MTSLVSSVASSDGTPRRRATDRVPPEVSRTWVYDAPPPSGTGRVLLLTWQGIEILGKWRANEYQAWCALPPRDTAREAALRRPVEAA